jgi:transcriptional regulator with XRE-family HTH domain
MQQMNIGENIAALRKKKGWTQQMLAQALGVSAPAVSKWETDSSYPDVTLLCPLARALDTNVDTLLRFSATLTQDEIVQVVNDVVQTAKTQGTAQAQQELEALAHRYPGDAALLYNLAMVWEGLFQFAPQADAAQRDQWVRHGEELMRRVYAMQDTAYQHNAALHLVMLAVADGRLEEAETLLDEVQAQMPPQNQTDPVQARAMLYLKQGRAEEALCLLQTRLYRLANETLGCLVSMMLPKLVADPARGRCMAHAYHCVAEVFGLADLCDGPLLEILLDAGDVAGAAALLPDYVRRLTEPVPCPEPLIFSPGVPCGEKNSRPISDVMCAMVYETLCRDKAFDAVRAQPQAQTAILELEAYLRHKGAI